MSQGESGGAVAAGSVPDLGAGQILDVVVAGGGPAGTAAAFRARELGMSVLVVEYDDLMKRIRDYSKDKLILPGFGGGDRMCFPLGGSLIDSLRFAPIDKDEMCACWKDLYGQHGLPTRIGFELTGLTRRDDGVYRVEGFDHAVHADAEVLARHVVIAIGRGVPRRFDIPGDTQGIAFRLEGPQTFVGQPVCVIGGGTSAAEAVIAVSNAKTSAGDETAVYWSYRGDKMPRVSKALAEVFFEAYLGNGNIRFFHRSEPAAVVTGDDRRAYLAVRTDRREIVGRPTETSHLEFPKESCIACIGEDIPTTLLASLGIEMLTGGPNQRRRLAVSRWLESCQENVFLVGDLLSPAYFETDDPDSLREVKHRGNIKSALRDGVLVAEAIRQRLDGKTEIEVTVGDADDLEGTPPAFVHSGAFAVGDDGPPAAAFDSGRRPAERAAFLARLLPGGLTGEEYPLAVGTVCSIGRSGCDLEFSEDTLLSDRHASVVLDEEGCTVRDDGSSGGVFLRLPIHRKLKLSPGDLLCAGRQFLLVGGDNGNLHVTQYDQQGAEVRRTLLEERTIILGRQAPDVILDADDRTLSRRQLSLSVSGGKVLAKDLKSVNGTFLKVRGTVQLEHGDSFRVGQQHFVFSARDDAVLDESSPSSPAIELPRESPPATAKSAATATADTPAADSPSVTFSGTGQTYPARPGQTICEVAEAHGVPIKAECHAGICGSDPIRILDGHEHLDSGPGDEESDTLMDLCGLEPGECRLACKAVVKGPVTVEILSGG